MKINRRNSRRNMALLLGGCAAISLPNLARADQTWDPTVANGSWNTPANWLGGVLPGAGDNATISFNDAADHTITYDGSYSSTTKTVTLTNLGGGNANLVLSNNYTLNAQTIQLGSNGKASVEQSDGTIKGFSFVMTAGGTLDAATYSLSGGTLSVDGLTVGGTGAATFNQSGGTVSLYEWSLGAYLGGIGHYEMSGGTLIASGPEYIGWWDSTSQFVQSGGTHINTSTDFNEDSAFSIHSDGNSNHPVPYLLTDGTLITNFETVTGLGLSQTGGYHSTVSVIGGYQLSGGQLFAEFQFGGNDQSGGTYNLGTDAAPGTFYADFYTLSGGAFNAIGSEVFGGGSPAVGPFATFTQSGGTHSIGTSITPSDMYLGYSFLGSHYILSDGALNVIGREFDGYNGTGSFLQSGGTHTIGTATVPGQIYVGYGLAINNQRSTYLQTGGDFEVTGTEYIGYNGIGSMTVSGGFQSLSGNMYLGGSDTLASATGKGTLTVSGGTLNISGTLKLWNNATASYSGGSVSLGGLDVGGGLFKIVAGKSRVLRTGSMSTSSGGKIDLNDNSIIVDYPDGGPTPESSIAAQIQNGYANGAWNGPGITSSVAASDPTRRIGYADNAVLGLDSFSGEPVDHSSVLVKLTYGGDANLDGAVNIADLEALAQNWNSSGDWLEGDFDYNGTVDVNDLKILALNWNAGESLTATEASLGLPLVVPEPSLTAFAVLVFCSGFNWQRKRKKED